MSGYYESMTQLIGRTPLLKCSHFAESENAEANIFAKLEYFNPAGSVKDRIALAMIEQAEGLGKLKPDATIIEPTSGNSGIGIASVAASKGYRAILTMPETMSIERRKLLKAYGAEIVLTEGSKGMKGAIAKAEELQEKIEGSIILSQFSNQANPEKHRCFCSWCRYRGNIVRCGCVFERKKARCESGCCRACRFPCTFQRSTWSS